MEFVHIPVLLEQTINGLNIKSNGIYCDGTTGSSGHSQKIAEKLDENGTLICFDRDIDAINTAKDRLKGYKCKIIFVHDSFINIPSFLSENNLKIDGLLLDLGVSSYQLSNKNRGFSYLPPDSVLDMRMNISDKKTAKDIVNNYSSEELENIFFKYGEERYSRRIVQKIVQYREKKEIISTLELVDIIKSGMPFKAFSEDQHPAKRVFQAIRIAVNDELEQLSVLLNEIIDHIKTNGRICCISFQSLEDVIIKNMFNLYEKPCTCPPDFPICVCHKVSRGKVITKKPIIPSEEECTQNPKSRSSKLRIFEKI